jgi:hypothetical protein
MGAPCFIASAYRLRETAAAFTGSAPPAGPLNVKTKPRRLPGPNLLESLLGTLDRSL